MDLSEIDQKCDAIVALVAEKGYFNPKVCIMLRWIFNHKVTLDLEYRTDAHSDTKTKFFHAEDFESAFDLCNDFVASMKSIKDAQREAFIAAVGKLIEQGRDIGMEVAFLNPLTAMMEKLSTNILEKK